MKCKHCGEDESEHHEFEPIVQPNGCVCDVKEWRFPPEVCDSYVDDRGHCFRCAHDKECHKP